MYSLGLDVEHVELKFLGQFFCQHSHESNITQ